MTMMTFIGNGCSRNLLPAVQPNRLALQPFKADLHGHRIAHRYQCLDLFAAGAADIDELFGKRDHPLAVLGFEQMDRLLADHPENRSAGAMNMHPLAGNQVRIDTSDRSEEDKAVGIDVLDQESDLVAMRCQQHPRSVRSGCRQCRNQVAEHVGRQALGHF
jgi:hypothetical protein